MPKDEFFKDLSEDELVDFFCEIFHHELESWFSADIACGDDCYDDFVNKWPAIYFRDLDFQKSSIDMQSFYSGSNLQNFFTEKECLQLVKNIHCPRCGNPIWNCFWPYNFNFNLPDDFECELQEIDRLLRETPLLLLSNSFAKKTLDIINTLGNNTEPIVISKKYYRARKLEKRKLYTNEDFKYPPQYRISEGRYNHAGCPVVYLADSVKTCFYELRNPIEGIAVAEINFSKQLRILDLIQLEDECNSIINIAAWSSLMSSPAEGDGWYKPHYTFTRFIADCAINAGFDAIKYQSVRVGESHNIVLINGQKEWANLNIIKILKMHFDPKGNLQHF